MTPKKARGQIHKTRAVDRFFVTGEGGGGIIAIAEGRRLVRGSGGILPGKFSNLEATRRYF